MLLEKLIDHADMRLYDKYRVKCGFNRSFKCLFQIMKFSKQFSLYESEATNFIKNLKQANPKLEQSQREGRALLWDKAPLDLDTQQRNQESRVAQQAYVYQNKG